MRFRFCFSLGLALLLLAARPLSAAESPLVQALLAPTSAQPKLIRAPLEQDDERLLPILEAWRSGEVFLYTADGQRVPFVLSANARADGTREALVIETGKPLADAQGRTLYFQAGTLTPLDTNAAIRRAIRDVTEVAGLSAPSSDTRRAAAERLGQSQRAEHLPLLQARAEREQSPEVRAALADAIALVQVKHGDLQAQLRALRVLKASHHLGVLTQLKELVAKAEANPGSVPPALVEAARSTITATENYFFWVNFFGTLFRGFSLGSVLLVTALGLAITYGLMGVINMAHGEVMVVGAYATYMTQTVFAGVFGAESSAFHYYFIAALPVAFVSAALVGAVLERGIIQWLYKRPLESLLATWGVSLALQQAFRTIFGASNVPIATPWYLMGNTTWHDIIFAYNRVFVIGFAAVVVVGTWLLLTRTRFGLYIRAVTQNRGMAACMGVPTERVNMMTFAFGSGLAGLAGACLTQLGNVGPGLGQTHIVDSFMVVVSGGVGNLAGTVFAALGIGAIDQVLQPFLGAVLGKIIVLVAIILFLQWKPGGLFPTRNRSLD